MILAPHSLFLLLASHEAFARKLNTIEFKPMFIIARHLLTIAITVKSTPVAATFSHLKN